MRKKIISLLTIVSIMFLSVIPSYAQPEDKSQSVPKFTRDTVITEKNMNDVLKSFGIDPSTGIPCDQENVKGSTTVGELEDSLKIAKQTPIQSMTNKSSINNNLSRTDEKMVSSYGDGITVEGSTYLTWPFYVCSDFSIEHSCRGYYTIYGATNTKEWCLSDSANVQLIRPPVTTGTVDYSIDRIISITSYVTPDNVIMESDFIVGTYIVIGVKPLAYKYFVTSNEHTCRNGWGTMFINF